MSASNARPVLLCYDGSPGAADAIGRAGEILHGGPALVLYVWLPPSAILLEGRVLEDTHPLAPATAEFDATASEDAQRIASEGAALASEAGFDAEPITAPAGRGIWRTIVELAEARDARAVVVGSHGRSTVGSALLGSVSHGVTNRCPRPVLVVPPGGEGRGEREG
jgi:nucleotide-binding universal stress UspA family protein